MGADGPQIILSGLVVRRNNALSGSVEASHPRKRWRREQVAAVCYRWQRGTIEFLLVRTRGGRWTFPKGGTERELTYAQAAAMEAFEEAGVHGRIEELPFTHYMHRKRDKVRQSGTCQLRVRAHLCEVLRQSRPQESGRTPTWFSAAKAIQRLSEDRRPKHGAELARVVDRAVLRIRRLQTQSEGTGDALQKVRFETLEQGPGRHGWQGRADVVLAVNSYLSEVRRHARKRLSQATGSNEAENAQVIEFHQGRASKRQ